MRLALALAAVALAAAPAVQARAADAPRAAERTAELERLVAMLVPEDAMVSLAAAFAARRADEEPETRVLAARHPGLRAHLAVALEPAVRKLLKRELPVLRGEIGAILAAGLTPREIADTADFLASPAGRTVHEGALRTIAEQPGLGDAEAGKAMLDAALAKVALRDYPAVMAFAASGAARKMQGINPRIAAASRGWADRLVEQNDKRIARLTRRAAKDFARQAERRRSA